MDTRIGITVNTVEFNCDILTNCQIWVVLYDVTHTKNLVWTVLSASEAWIPVKLTYTLEEDITLSMRILQVSGSISNITYMDNLSLTIK